LDWKYGRNVINKLFGLLLGIIFFALKAPALPDWKYWAQRFTGESESVRQLSIRQLKKIPNLDRTLKKELSGIHRYLAMDVIGTLRLYEMRPELMRLAEADTSGFCYVTLNSLFTTQNQEMMLKFYLESLSDDAVSAAAKVVIIDTLARMRQSLHLDLLKNLLFQQASPELQSATLEYVRHTLNLRPPEDTIGLLKKALRSEIFQLRVQTMILVSELLPPYRSRVLAGLGLCRSEKLEEVQRVCRQLESRWLQ
jgi:hypothetical protein